jgi:hypothetical protein
MNKALLRILCPVLMLASGLAFTLALSPATAHETRTKVSAAHHPNLRVESGLRAAAFYQALTPTPTPEPVSQPGSTDGIMILSIAIVLIIIIPILLQRSMWKK